MLNMDIWKNAKSLLETKNISNNGLAILSYKYAKQILSISVHSGFKLYILPSRAVLAPSKFKSALLFFV